MFRDTFIGAVLAAPLVLLALGFVIRQSVTKPAAGPSSPAAAAAAGIDPALLYGRITAADGTVYEGQLRWGRNQEASWGDFFDGTKDENPWAAHSSLTQPAEQGTPIEIFGFKLGAHDPSMNLRRRFMARFGDIARIEGDGDVQVTLKSGTMYRLNRSEAGDIDDGVRVWDGKHGLVDLDGGDIRLAEFMRATSAPGPTGRLHGTVRTLQGDFTGYIQWNRDDSIGADELSGRSGEGEVSQRYDTIRSVARHSRNSARVTLLDGRELVLAGTRESGQGNLGIYVDDRRYGRVLVSWDALDRVDFSPAGNGPGYGDFPPGQALTGSVATRDGRRLAGRLVIDFDESETTESMDADLDGIAYNIPFGLIASIAPRGPAADGPPRATVILHDGEELHFRRTGDLADGNAGVLIFLDGGERPEFVPWADVDRIELERPATMYPPLSPP